MLLCSPLISLDKEYIWDNTLFRQDFFDENNWIDTATVLNTPVFSNKFLFYIYDDGTVEKNIIVD